MTSNVELLPLPDWMECLGEVSAEDIRDYARDNVARATALLRAEIEALRAGVVLERNLKADAIHACALANIRAERLAEVLRRILDNEAPDWKFAEEFGGYVLDDELREEALAALEQEDEHEQ